MKTIQLISFSGKSVIVTIDFECRIEHATTNMDGYMIDIGTKLYKKESVIAEANGIIWPLRDYRYRDKSEPWEKVSELDKKLFEENPELYCLIRGHNSKGRYISLSLTRTEYDKLKSAINSEREHNTTDEAKAYIEKQKDAEKEAEIIELQKYVKRAEEVMSKKGRLMTESEAQVWKKEYNKLSNEDGEGFIPDVITKEKYEASFKRLNQLNNA